MAYISVHSVKTNSNGNSYYITANVISSGGTDSTLEAFEDDAATSEDINAAIAEAARNVCRANNESIDNDAPVMIFGAAVQVV